ncbi:heptosyltransferase [Anaeromyxobacter paludicola]|uniref:Heptosyltransferase n=1 Tax=Anaeromyxobacter paludicola TaxID=2918171 RepID=A0ABN6N743_9BACT|nr:heptosyltransferase [Anaeromyxobacter paludicola]
MLRLATLLFPTPQAALPPLADVRRVLVIRADERVGNQLLTTPLLRALKLGLPAAEVHLLAAARQAQVVATRHVDRVIPFEKRALFRRPWRFLALLRSLRRARYDVVVEAAHWSGFSLTASLLARVASAGGPVVGHDRGASARFLSHPVAHDPANASEVRAKLELLRPFGLTPRGLEPETELGRDAAPARALLARLGLAGRPLAVLNPGARMADRRWPPEAHAEVARGLLARGLAVLVVWGPGEEPLARGVAEGSGAALAPATDLTLLAGLLREAALCVSNNSGPMHLAVAVGTPTVGVFLSGDAARWGHELPAFAAAEPLPGNGAAAVLAACDRLLSAAGAAPPRPAGTRP